MLDDGLEIPFIVIQGDMLGVPGNAGIICTEEYCLANYYYRSMAHKLGFVAYHKPNRSRLRCRENLGKDLDGVCSVIASTNVSLALAFSSSHSLTSDGCA